MRPKIGVNQSTKYLSASVESKIPIDRITILPNRTKSGKNIAAMLLKLYMKEKSSENLKPYV